MPADLKYHRTNLLVWFLFVLVLAYLKFTYHELWKDEWQAWFVAKDKSIAQIFSFLYYEGHPALWYVFLKLFSAFSDIIKPVVLIQIVHLITVAAGLYMLIVKFRLPLVLKILFASSYFLFFEYGLINRGYFLVIFLVFLSTWLLEKKNYSGWQMAIVLFLLCQTEVYGVFMAFSIGVYIILNNDQPSSFLKAKSIWGLLFGFLIFIVSVYPREQGHIARTRGKELGFLDNILTAFQGNFSNTYLIGSTNDTFTYGWTYMGIFLSLACVVALWYVFRKNTRLLITCFLFLTMMLSFSIFFFSGGIRQWGMGFIFFIALLECRSIDVKGDKIIMSILIIFGIFNAVHCGKAVLEEISIPFTNAEKAGIFIKEKVPAKVPIVAINKFEATPVIGYAGRMFYEMPDGKEFSYFKWVDKIYLPVENELKLFAKFKGVGGIVVISPKQLDSDRFPSLQLWQKFDDKNYKNENYYIYTLPLKAQNPVPPQAN